jgi:predicted DNA-binding transcriptional regulator AlpA
MDHVLSQLKKLLLDLTKKPKRLLNIEEAANYVGISPKTLRNMLCRGAKKPFPVRPVRVGGKPLFKIELLDAFIDSLF